MGKHLEYGKKRVLTEAGSREIGKGIGYNPGTVTSTNYISTTNPVNKNLSALDAAVHGLAYSSSLKVVKKTIGGVGVAGCDFNFATAANETPQNIDLGAIIPAYGKVVSVITKTTAAFTGAVTLQAIIGNASSGNQYVTTGSIFATTDAIDGGATPLGVAVSVSAGHVWLQGTPGANWSLVTAGKVAVYILYNDITGL